MSDFLMIIPAGWTQLDLEYISNNVTGLGLTDIKNGIIQDIEQRLKDAAIIPAESSLTDFKLIDDAYFLIKLG